MPPVSPGAVAGLAGFLTLRSVVAAVQDDREALTWPTDVPVPWLPAALIVLAVPVLATLEARFALRRAAVDPLGAAARRPRRHCTGPGMWLLGPVALLAGIGLVLLGRAVDLNQVPVLPILVAILALCALGAGVHQRRAGAAHRRLAARWGCPALLIAAERLRERPVGGGPLPMRRCSLVTVAGTGLRRASGRHCRRPRPDALLRRPSPSTPRGLDLTGAALLSPWRSRSAASPSAPPSRWRPAAGAWPRRPPPECRARGARPGAAPGDGPPAGPGVLLAGTGGLPIGGWFARLPSPSGALVPPYTALLVPAAVYAAAACWPRPRRCRCCAARCSPRSCGTCRRRRGHE